MVLVRPLDVGYNIRVLLVIAMTAFGGLLCALMLKHAGATHGCFSTALSIILTCISSLGHALVALCQDDHTVGRIEVAFGVGPVRGAYRFLHVSTPEVKEALVGHIFAPFTMLVSAVCRDQVCDAASGALKLRCGSENKTRFI